MGLVYVHISPSNKVYVGITSKTAKQRGRNGKGYKRHQPLFYNAILKYGGDNFIHKVLFNNITEKDAKLIEIDLIYYYKKIGKSYNITDGGDGTRGRPNSEHARRLISEAQKKRPIEQYTLDGTYVQTFESVVAASKAIGKAIYQNNHGYAARGLSRSCNEGTVAYGFRGKYVDQKELKIALNKSTKPIVQLSLEGEFINKFDSGVHAECQTGIDHKLISACCTGKRKTTKGYRGMFYNDYLNTMSQCLNLPEDPINIKGNDTINKNSQSG